MDALEKISQKIHGGMEDGRFFKRIPGEVSKGIHGRFPTKYPWWIA